MKQLLVLIGFLAYMGFAAGKESGASAAAKPVRLQDFRLVGDLSGEQAAFTLSATAIVEPREGATLEFVSGNVALTELGLHSKWKVRAEPNRFVIDFEKAGKYSIQIKFNAAVREEETWKRVDFRVARSAIAPIQLKGLPEDTKFDFSGAARPERKGDQFVTFLPADGAVKIAWKQARTETEGKLFFSSEMLSQISLSPGLMRESAIFNFKIMQGELSRVALLLDGDGEVTRVQGESVLGWNVEGSSKNQTLNSRETPNSKRQNANTNTATTQRRLVIQLNQAQKDQFTVQVQMQRTVGAFPQSMDAIRIHPEGATRFAGYVRIVNEGAVRLEVTQAKGLSQISPEQFPETDMTRTLLRSTGNQRFAYRFSGEELALRIQADQVLPEVNVSEIAAYRIGESEQTIDAELELDIREAPLRELLLEIPAGYAVAKLNAPGLSDYFQHDLEQDARAQLKLIYSQPVSGRQLVQLRLERNKALGETTWTLPRIDTVRAKSVRGHIAIASDAGLRVSAEKAQGVTEIATAFFPAKIQGVQAAFRLTDATWHVAAHIERLPQTVQVDGFHLFSIGEGIAYGSSVMNYAISGAPISSFEVELSDEYYNVEFIGKDIRDWKKTERGYIVHLHTPVSGAYTLLATYERPFKAQGDTLAFTAARPLDAITDQGNTIIVSAYQFQVKPVEISAGLLQLEPREVPAEYRLFFDAPILAAYRYNVRPFNLKLSLSPLVQGESVNQVVDRAFITNHISKEGQVLTDVRYFLKNRGNPHLRLTLPPEMALWSATVNGTPVVPVLDGAANLVPLPQRADPNALLTIDLKLASRARHAKHVSISAPKVNAPVMLLKWTVEPDTNQRLAFDTGSLSPAGGIPDASGFATLARMFSAEDAGRARNSLFLALLFAVGALLFWRLAGQPGVHKFSVRYLVGLILGGVCFIAGLSAFAGLLALANEHSIGLPRNLMFVAPVQQAQTDLTVSVTNIPEKLSVPALFGYVWPVLLALALWLSRRLTENVSVRRLASIASWTVLAWAALRAPTGAPFFVALVMVFLIVNVAMPVLIRLWRIPRQSMGMQSGAAGAAPAVTTVIVLAAAWLSAGSADVSARTTAVDAVNNGAVAESVLQSIRVEEKFAIAAAKIRWHAEKGEALPLIWEPAVLTGLNYRSNSLSLMSGKVGGKRVEEVVAKRAGTYDFEVRYEMRVSKNDDELGFALPVQFGLVNRVTLTVTNSDVDVLSPHAVSVQRKSIGSSTVAELVLSPAPDTWVGWKPRRRDVKHEKPVFYAELWQLYAPAAGVIEGAHQINIRPAQGQISELVLDVPTNTTITDVLNASGSPSESKSKRTEAASLISLWRFDPDTRKLRVTLNPAQSRPFTFVVRSQIPTSPLPFGQAVGLLSVESGAGQVGMLGFATGNDVQLDDVNPGGLSAINLEDFSAETVERLRAQTPGLTLRRAYRYSSPAAVATIKASAVEPDVRIEAQDTLSLGEDRTVLAENAAVSISRAGIFKLSFLLPESFDVESISGGALSHWTELKEGSRRRSPDREESGRIITLHLNGKTEGEQQFSITLTGPGARARKGWKTPQVVFREAGKQRGSLLVVPEQGMRLQIASFEGVSPLDPQKAGIKQKGVLSFRVLQAPWNLALDVEQVDAWIQVTSLQHVKVSDGQLSAVANLLYQIENTGLKTFRVWVPTNAEGVQFQGEQVSDFMKVTGLLTNGLQGWDIKLHRRVIGAYRLRATYQQSLAAGEKKAILRGVKSADANLQRGFVTIQATGRLQVDADAVPEALQSIEWQSIPRSLQQELQGAPANFAFRLVDPSFELPLRIERHEAAKLLAARVNSVTFSSVVSDDGITLTQARLEILPGDKRLLRARLPEKSRFWFAFVDERGVWPWREGEEVLVPLEAQCRTGQPISVEVFYSSGAGAGSARALELELLAPKFDLPLENITWRVCLGEKWKVKHWTGTLQLEHEEVTGTRAGEDLEQYLQEEAKLQVYRTKEAEDFLNAGNAALQNGDPQQARRSFQAAFGLSGHDAAFNEDARVQLHNIKLQQALVGLNVRQATASGDAEALGKRLGDLRTRKELNYTQQDAKDMIDRNTADDNIAFMRVAERMVQQQDAAISNPGTLRAAVPQQGRVLTFKRSVVVDQLINAKEDLKIGLRAKAVSAASGATRIAIVGLCFGGFGLLHLAVRRMGMQ